MQNERDRQREFEGVGGERDRESKKEREREIKKKKKKDNGKENKRDGGETETQIKSEIYIERDGLIYIP